MLGFLYLYSPDPDIKDSKRALHAAEAALRSSQAPEVYALAAEAAYETGLYSLAAQYQKEAIVDGASDQSELKARLELFSSLAQAMPKGPGAD